MHHLLLLALSGIALAGAASSSQSLQGEPVPTGADCLERGPTPAMQRPKVEAKRLGELPSGSLVLTVLRKENGCTTPVIIRQGYGPETQDEPVGRPFENGSARR